MASETENTQPEELSQQTTPETTENAPSETPDPTEPQSETTKDTVEVFPAPPEIPETPAKTEEDLSQPNPDGAEEASGSDPNDTDASNPVNV